MSTITTQPQDAHLILQKWITEKVRVIAFVTHEPPGLVARIEGRITDSTEKAGQGYCLLQSDDDYIVFTLHGCVIGYGESFPMFATLEEALSREKMTNWKAGLFLGYSGNVNILLCTME